MKINTLTTYDVYNYGASLQAYALQQYLLNLGHQVEIINYQPAYLTRKYDYKWVNPESKLSRYALTRFVYRIMKYPNKKNLLHTKPYILSLQNQDKKRDHGQLHKTHSKLGHCLPNTNPISDDYYK